MKTIWLEYPEIEVMYHKLGIETALKKYNGNPYYCVPLIFDPNTKTLLQDSVPILKYLDKAYPDKTPLYPKGTHAFQEVFADFPLLFIIMPTLVYKWWASLSDASKPFFQLTREDEFHNKLENVSTEQDWKNTEEAFAKFDLYLKANGEGKDELFLGDQICAVDIQLASVLMWAQIIFGEDSAEWKRICGWNGGKWKRVLERFSQWRYLDD